MNTEPHYKTLVARHQHKSPEKPNGLARSSYIMKPNELARNSNICTSVQ